MKNGSLKLYIETNKGNIPLKQKLLFIYEISLAIEYMHTRNQKILHRDIKSSNVILDDNLHCKLCDFGMSKNYDNNKSNQNDNNTCNLNTNYQTNSQSTLFWMSPEYLCDGIINEKSDIYSFGILIWEIFMEDTSPYKNININDYLLGNKDVVYYKRPIIIDENFKDCPDIKELMKLMWNQDYNKRPDIGHIIDMLEDLNNQIPFL
jgi:serine/threonine protein kinase